MSTATTASRRTDPAPRVMPTTVATTRRRAPTRIMLGLLVIVIGFVTGAVVLTRVNKAENVLAVARPVATGATLSAADLTTVAIVANTPLHVFTAQRQSEVIGRTATMPLAQGSLLVASEIGPVADPGAGQSLVALAVTDGHLPAGLTAGTSVVVLVVPVSATATTTPVQATGVIRDVDIPDTSGATVVTVQMASGDATRIASAPGTISIIVQGS